MAVVPLSTPAPARTHHALRQRLEAAIEAAIALLDSLDPDPDLEPEEDADHDGREPDEGDIGWMETGDGSQVVLRHAPGWI